MAALLRLAGVALVFGLVAGGIIFVQFFADGRVMNARFFAVLIVTMVAGFGLGDTFGRSLGARIRAAHAALWLVIIALSAALSWSISAGVDVLFGRDHTPLAPVAFIVGAIVGAAGVRAQRRKRDADSKQDSERSMKSVAMVAAFIKRQNAG